jgi:hypothetical protein
MWIFESQLRYALGFGCCEVIPKAHGGVGCAFVVGESSESSGVGGVFPAGAAGWWAGGMCRWSMRGKEGNRQKKVIVCKGRFRHGTETGSIWKLSGLTD